MSVNKEIYDALLKMRGVTPDSFNPNRSYWEINLQKLEVGVYGEPTSNEALLKYWKEQALYGYPKAYENVQYFEDMLKKERTNER